MLCWKSKEYIKSPNSLMMAILSYYLCQIWLLYRHFLSEHRVATVSRRTAPSATTQHPALGANFPLLLLLTLLRVWKVGHTVTTIKRPQALRCYSSRGAIHLRTQGAQAIICCLYLITLYCNDSLEGNCWKKLFNFQF